MYISRCFCFIHNFSFLCLLPAHSGVYSGGDRTAAAAWNSRGYKIHELWHAEVYVVWIIKTNYLSDSIILEHVSDAGVPSSAGVCNTANVSALIYSSRLHVMTVLWLEIRACRVFLYLHLSFSQLNLHTLLRIFFEKNMKKLGRETYDALERDVGHAGLLKNGNNGKDNVRLVL